MADNYTDFGVIGDLSEDQQGGVFSGLTLDYVSTAHFGVTITNGASLDKTTLTPVTQFAVTTSPSLTVTLDFSAIPEYSDPLAPIDMVRIYRTTPTTVAERTFVDGSVLKASDINTQNKQLLLGLQERGRGDITVDTDGKLDAAANLAGVATQIKNVARPDFDNEVATKGYVDSAAVYGGAFAAGDPQYWTFTTADDDGRIYTLDDPDPASTSSNMFLVEVGGILQDPETYTITLSSGVYYLTLIDGATNINDGVDVIVRNFGASRNLVTQPYQHKDDLAATVALQVQRPRDSTLGDMQQWQNEGGTALAKVDKDGNATFVDLHCLLGNADIDGNLNVDGSLFLDGASTLTGNISAGADITAIGKVDTTGILIDKGNAAGQGIQTADTTGLFYFSDDGPVVQYGVDNYIQARSDKVLVKGNLEISAGDFTVDGGITVNPESGSGLISLKGTGRIFTPAYSYTGLQLGEHGPSLMFDSENYLTVTTDSVYIYGDTVIRGTGGLNMGKVLDGTEEALLEHGQIKNMAEPTAASDAATKNYVDTHGKVLLQTINGANDGTGIVEQTGCSAYSEIQMEFHNVKNDTTGEGYHPPAFRLRNSDGDTLDPLVAGTQSATTYKMDETHWYADNLNWLIGSKWVSIGEDNTINRWENYAWSGLATFRMIGNAILLNFWASINLPSGDGENSFGENVALWHGEFIYNSSSLATMDQIRFAFIDKVSTDSPQNGSGVGAGTVKVYGIK